MLLQGVFQPIVFQSDRLGTEQQNNDRLVHLLEVLAKEELDLRPSQLQNHASVGDTFHFMLQQFACTPKKTACDFYTPDDVAQLMVALAAPLPGERVGDPVAGAAGLLCAAAHYIQQQPPKAKPYTLYGQECDGVHWALGKCILF